MGRSLHRAWLSLLAGAPWAFQGSWADTGLAFQLQGPQKDASIALLGPWDSAHFCFLNEKKKDPTSVKQKHADFLLFSL